MIRLRSAVALRVREAPGNQRRCRLALLLGLRSWGIGEQQLPQATVAQAVEGELAAADRCCTGRPFKPVWRVVCRQLL